MIENDLIWRIKSPVFYWLSSGFFAFLSFGLSNMDIPFSVIIISFLEKAQIVDNPQIFLNLFLFVHAFVFPTISPKLKNINISSTWVSLQPMLWENIFWVCVLPESDPEFRIQVSVVYFGNDFRKHSRDLGKRNREWKEGNEGWITKQVITVNKQLNLTGIPGKLFKTVASE